jgi:hypothetical protein
MINEIAEIAKAEAKSKMTVTSYMMIESIKIKTQIAIVAA